MDTYEPAEAHAFKIVSIKAQEDGSALIALGIPDYPPIPVDAEYVTKHQPIAGGYYVVGADGYKSYLPVEAIEG